MIALILRGGVPYRIFPSVEERAAFLAEIPLDAAHGETLAEDATHDTVPDGDAYAWNGTAFVARPVVTAPAPVLTMLSVLDFKARFTDAERLRIDSAEIDHPSITTRATLKRVREDLADCRDKLCDRADPRIQRGVAYLTTVTYDGAPLLTEARMLAIIGADAFNPANLA